MIKNDNIFLVEKGERGFSLELPPDQIEKFGNFLKGSSRPVDRQVFKNLYSTLSDRGYALIIRHGQFEESSDQECEEFRTLFSILWSSKDHYYNLLTTDQNDFNPWEGQTWNSCRFKISEITLNDEWEEDAKDWLEDGSTAIYAIKKEGVLFPWLRDNCCGLDSEFDCRDNGVDYGIKDETFEELIKDAVLINLFGYKTQKKEKEMSNTPASSSKITAITARVKDKGLAVLEYQAGKSLNTAVMELVRPRLPLMLRGYADHAVAPVVITLGLAALTEFMPEGEAKKKAVIATDLMLGASMMDGADKLLNVEELVKAVMNKLPTDVVKTIEDAAAAQ